MINKRKLKNSLQVLKKVGYLALAVANFGMLYVHIDEASKIQNQIDQRLNDFEISDAFVEYIDYKEQDYYSRYRSGDLELQDYLTSMQSLHERSTLREQYIENASEKEVKDLTDLEKDCHVHDVVAMTSGILASGSFALALKTKCKLKNYREEDFEM